LEDSPAGDRILCEPAGQLRPNRGRKRLADKGARVPEEFARQPAGPIEFKSARANPGFFDLSKDACSRIAVTGTHPGATIFINTDLIENSALGFPAIGSWVSLLVHELAHHQGELDTPTRPLDALGNKVARQLAKSWSPLALPRIPLARFGVAVYSAIPGAMPVTAIWDDETAYLIDGARGLEATLKVACGSVSTRSSARQALLSLSNPRWIEGNDQPRSDLHALIDATVDCGSGPTLLFFKFGLSVQTGVGAKVIAQPTRFTEAFINNGEYSYEQDLEVLEIASASREIIDGGKWRVSAKIRLNRPDHEPILGCGANFSSEQVQSRLGTGRPMAWIFDDCKLTQLGKDLYQVELETSFPVRSPDRDYSIYSIMLLIESNHGYAGAPPSLQQATVRVRSSNPLPALHVTGYTLQTSVGELSFQGFSKQYGYHEDEKFYFDVVFDAPVDILFGYMWGEVFTATQPRQRLELNGPLGKFDQWSLGLQLTPQGSGTLARYTFQIPRVMGETLPVLAYHWTRLIFFMRDFREVIVEIPQKELAAYSMEKIRP
jgi:hypothetical protein